MLRRRERGPRPARREGAVIATLHNRGLTVSPPPPGSEPGGSDRVLSEKNLAVVREPPSMSNAAIEARRLTLIRFERAAGTVFGCEDDAPSVVPQARILVNGLTIALATVATALAATITYLA
ncbi:hypothetical protein [Methylobacterium sp. WL64]|uniref:hypothetical protein n=1 Tax=Methylobacterium sp. WL64 TaxID=2603894 RepID=UPI001FEE99B6|nr:hypothetical protein [Methylobacterium sp. WL64]